MLCYRLFFLRTHSITKYIENICWEYFIIVICRKKNNKNALNSVLKNWGRTEILLQKKAKNITVKLLCRHCKKLLLMTECTFFFFCYFEKYFSLFFILFYYYVHTHTKPSTVFYLFFVFFALLFLHIFINHRF